MEVAEKTMGEAEQLDEEIAALKEQGQNYHTSPNQFPWVAVLTSQHPT